MSSLWSNVVALLYHDELPNEWKTGFSGIPSCDLRDLL
jgi:hypothetical protein